ncbi:heavy metal translocating P-type ATPase [Brevibacillus daliensis]|uniref:heavy metal translocating P-type ATPase n=1 Tax=Brevibacillus daliensis TaxID=2892995 RepID=UPI001E5809C8|nr:cation-translocating P-type ATPase [Brevibacillus daliensis]
MKEMHSSRESEGNKSPCSKSCCQSAEITHSTQVKPNHEPKNNHEHLHEHTHDHAYDHEAHDHHHNHDHSHHQEHKAHSSCSCETEHDNNDGKQSIAEARHVYRVEGMDCGSCAISLEKHIKKSLHLNQVDVSFSTGKLRLGEEADVDQVLKAISEAGYRGTYEKAGTSVQEEPIAHWWRQEGIQRTILAGLFLIVGLLLSSIDLDTAGNFSYAGAMLIAGWRPFKAAWYSIKNKSADMNLLMTLAAIGAGLIGEWFEGATVVFLFGLGNALQTISINKTRQSIRTLLRLTPKEAMVWRNQQYQLVSVDEIRPGEQVLIKAGERIPLDGEIMKGSSAVNQAPITGESLPVDKQKGDVVFAGTINETAALEMKVTRIGKDTTLARIIHLVEEAQEKKAPTEQFVEKFARIYTPIVIVLAAAVIILPPLFTGDWQHWFYRGLELLVIACPCALVISTPVAVVSAIGSAARHGILIKGGSALEAIGHVKQIAFDKTGTITSGQLQVEEIIVKNGYGKQEVMEIAATIEHASRHPIASAIMKVAESMQIQPQASDQHETLVGKGAKATIGDIAYLAGNRKLFMEYGVDLSSIGEEIDAYQKSGKTIVLIGTTSEIWGGIIISDTIRSSSKPVMDQLHRLGVSTMLLTGDNAGAGNAMANQVGIANVRADLLPEQKWQAIEEAKKDGPIGMVGDGINDAPALAAADVGIAMGGAGTDTAMETAGIVLMADDLEKLPFVIDLSKKALTIIKQNIWFSIIIKLIALLLIIPNWLTLWMAVVSDTGAALLVIANSMRLLRK